MLILNCHFWNFLWYYFHRLQQAELHAYHIFITWHSDDNRKGRTKKQHYFPLWCHQWGLVKVNVTLLLGSLNQNDQTLVFCEKPFVLFASLIGFKKSIKKKTKNKKNLLLKDPLQLHQWPPGWGKNWSTWTQQQHSGIWLASNVLGLKH